MANFLKDLGAGGILAPHLNAWFARAKFPDEISFTIRMNKEADDAFHPSSAIVCARKLYALRKGHVQRDNSSLPYKAFMFGHFFHEIVQYILVHELKFATSADIEKEFYLQSKTPAGNPYTARGFIDIARCNVPHKPHPYLVDIKTVNARYFNMNELPIDVWEKYYAQVQVYLDWEDLPEAILLCAEKDSPHRFKEFIIQRNPIFVDRIYRDWESVVDAQVNDVPPACTCDPEDCPTKDIYATYTEEASQTG